MQNPSVFEHLHTRIVKNEKVKLSFFNPFNKREYRCRNQNTHSIQDDIVKTLTDEGVPTPVGKRQCDQTTIKSILSNEK